MSDTVFGFGDTPGDLDRRARGGNDELIGQAGPVVNEIYGDAGGRLLDRAHGGDDMIQGAASFVNLLVGDADAMQDRSRGGADLLLGGAGATVNELVGDASTMSGRARGGEDRLARGDGAFQNTLYGDARVMEGQARGGDDLLEGGGSGFNGTAGTVIGPLNVLVGDAGTMEGSARGGDDRLVASDGALTNTLYGDAVVLTDHARGGDDTLIGSAAQDLMFGDARDIGAGAHTGRDLFVIAPGGGPDTIGDFESGHDRIELRDFAEQGVECLGDLQIEATASGLMLRFADGSSLTLAGVDALRGGDVLFG